VAFYSSASNLAPGDRDSIFDVFVKNIVTGDITLASTSSGGIKGNNDSTTPSIASNGGSVAFQTIATNLDPADPDNISDLYVKTLSTSALTLASTSTTGSKGNCASAAPSLSSDGLVIGFESCASNLDPRDVSSDVDIFAKDVSTGLTQLATVTDAGAIDGFGSSAGASVSGNGTFVSFSTDKTLDPLDPDSIDDVYRRDLGG
jgi:hypothetical protein